MSAPIRPPDLGHGARAQVVAPAGPVRETADFRAGLALLERRWRTACDPAVEIGSGFLAGDDARRLGEMQRALDDPAIALVIAARGGFGCTRIVDDLDFAAFLDHPSWLVGSSDLTALLMELWARAGVQTIHGPMVERLGRAPAAERSLLFALLEGAPWRPPEGLVTWHAGAARGPLIGGNLTVLAHLAGTIHPGVTDGAILFLEDVAEQPYRLDRALVQLERAGWAAGVAGVVLGEFTSCAPGPDGVTAEQVLRERTGRWGVPVASGYPAAHGARNHPFVHGGAVELSCEVGGAGLREIERG